MQLTVSRGMFFVPRRLCPAGDAPTPQLLCLYDHTNGMDWVDTPTNSSALVGTVLDVPMSTFLAPVLRGSGAAFHMGMLHSNWSLQAPKDDVRFQLIPGQQEGVNRVQASLAGAPHHPSPQPEDVRRCWQHAKPYTNTHRPVGRHRLTEP